MTLDPNELFRCILLQCRLTRRSCGERNVRAEALQKDDKTGNWVPQRWAHLASPCRECKIGSAHVDLCEVARPEVPEIPRSLINKKTSRGVPPKQCERCDSLFIPSSNRQKRCPQCSDSRRLRKLREDNISVCFVCSKPYRPSSQTMKPMICPSCTASGRALGSGETKR